MTRIFQYSKHEWIPQKCTIAVFDSTVRGTLILNNYYCLGKTKVSVHQHIWGQATHLCQNEEAQLLITKKFIVTSNHVITLQLRNRIMIILLVIFAFMKIKMSLWCGTAHCQKSTPSYTVLCIGSQKIRGCFMQNIFSATLWQYTNYSNYPFKHHWLTILCSYTRKFYGIR